MHHCPRRSLDHVELTSKLISGTRLLTSEAEFVLCGPLCLECSTLGMSQGLLYITLEPSHPLSQLFIKSAVCASLLLHAKFAVLLP